MFLAFEQSLGLWQQVLARNVRGVGGCQASAVQARVTQKFVEGLLPRFARAAVLVSSRPGTGTRISTQSFEAVVGEAVVAPRSGQRWRGVRDFLTHWVVVMLALASGCRPGAGSRRIVLGLDIGDADLFRDDGDAGFRRFSDEGPIEALRLPADYYIGADTSRGAPTGSRFRYLRRPLIAAVSLGRLGAAGRMRALGAHIRLLPQGLVAIWLQPFVAVLGRELAWVAAMAALDKSGVLVAVVTTCSGYRDQPLWLHALRRAPVHMIWYAQNWRPPTAIGDQPAHYPYLRWIAADVHWVWTASFARFLQEVVKGDVRAVGPLVWTLPDTPRERRGPWTMTVFDVPAVHDDVMIDLNGEVENHLHPSKLLAFLDDACAAGAAVAAETGEPVRVLLKMKRGFRPDYAREYYDAVDARVARGDVEVVATGDLWQIIQASDCVVAYPFTSPPYVAEALGVPGAFHDATARLQRGDFTDQPDRIRFTSGRDQLVSSVLEWRRQRL